ncbi:MAG: hypothetical protein ACXABY_08825 [Candidatus Thorarchaeota archaeon]|jgi:hypothetical protein
MPLVKVEGVHNTDIFTSAIAICPACEKRNVVSALTHFVILMLESNPDASGHVDCYNPDCHIRLTVMLRDLMITDLTGMEPMLSKHDNPDVTGIEPGIGKKDI